MMDDEGLLALMSQLPEELQEEGSTGRDLIDNIIYEAKREEMERIGAEGCITYGRAPLKLKFFSIPWNKWQDVKGGRYGKGTT